MSRGSFWLLNRDTLRWRAGLAGVSMSATAWFLAEAELRHAGMVAGVALILSVVWILFDGLYAIHVLFRAGSGSSERSVAPVARATSAETRKSPRSVEYRRLALDVVWLVSIASAFWIGGAVAMQRPL